MKTKPSSVKEIRKQTKNLIDAHKKSIQDFHENHFPHLFGREGKMSEAEREELIEKMALVMFEYVEEQSRLRFRDVARAALAIAEPVIREECAKICDRRYMGDNNREDMEARRCAAAIREGGDKDD